jgi:hypothetical protein
MRFRLLDKIAGWQRQSRALDTGYGQSPAAYREIAQRAARMVHSPGCRFPAEDCSCEEIARGGERRPGRHRRDYDER